MLTRARNKHRWGFGFSCYFCGCCVHLPVLLDGPRSNSDDVNPRFQLLPPHIAELIQVALSRFGYLQQVTRVFKIVGLRRQQQQRQQSYIDDDGDGVRFVNLCCGNTSFECLCCWGLVHNRYVFLASLRTSQKHCVDIHSHYEYIGVLFYFWSYNNNVYSNRNYHLLRFQVTIICLNTRAFLQSNSL